MAKYILQEAGNINWMAIFSLITFVFVFVLAVLLVCTRNTQSLNKMALLPLDDESESLHFNPLNTKTK